MFDYIIFDDRMSSLLYILVPAIQSLLYRLKNNLLDMTSASRNIETMR